MKPLAAPLLAFACLGSADHLLAQDWVQVTGPMPPGAYGNRMAYNEHSQAMVLFGGLPTTAAWPPPVPLAQTWTYANGAWAQQAPVHAPPARSHHGMCYDPYLHAVVVFGGLDSNGSPMNDVWWYDGVDWQTIYYSNAPAARAYPSLCSDGGLVLFGGWSPVQGYFGDMWTWSSLSGWYPFGSLGPSPRRGAAMTRIRVTLPPPAYTGFGFLLHGGRSATVSNLDDTWIYASTPGWQQVQNAGGPPREEAGIGYDDVTRQAFLVAGHHAATTTGFANDIWRFDGERWHELPTAHRPPEVIGPAVAMDPTRQRLVLFGGGTGVMLSQVSNEHWEFAPLPLNTTFGSSCSPFPITGYISAGLCARGETWTGTAAISNYNNMTFAVFAIGFSDTSWNGTPLPLPLGALGLPNCDLLVEPFLLLAEPLQGGIFASSATYHLPIPDVPSAYGMDLYVQAFGGNAFGIHVATPAVRATIW